MNATPKSVATVYLVDEYVRHLRVKNMRTEIRDRGDSTFEAEVVPGLVRRHGDDFYFVEIAVKVSSSHRGKRQFALDFISGAAFQFGDIEEYQHDSLLKVTCPTIVLPYARLTCAMIARHSGLTPFLLPDVNFETLYDNLEPIVTPLDIVVR